MSELPLLLSPFQLRGKTIKNRICVSAHATGLNPTGNPSDTFINYQREKARNGVGLLMMAGSASVHPTAPNSDWGGINIWSDDIIPYFQRISDACKPYGTVIMMQISHRGRRANRDVSWLPTYAPSDIPEPLHKDIPHEIQPDEIPWLVAAYANAAVRLKKGGFDGLEISAAHGHLIDQFWSPISNQRTDEFGGSLENRMRFGMMVIDAVRAAVGDDFIVGIRITGDELIENGLTSEDMQEIALRLAATGKIDIINVIGAIGTTEYHQALTVPSMNYPMGVHVPYAAVVKSRLNEAGYNLPVIAMGRIVEPRQAEQILAEGQGDFVVMNRALIADHELPRKIMAGRLDDIRLCMGANEGCIGRLYRGKPIVCVQNPVIGREAELADWEPAREQKQVVVVGGGPGGLEAARMAALRGHSVILLEKSQQLGGNILLAAKAPNRESYSSSVGWLEGQVRKLGVDIRLGTEATVESVLALKPNCVVVATGSTPRRLPLPGGDLAFVVTAREAIAESAPVGANVLMIDENHHQEGLSVSEFLAARGHHVTVISRLWVAGEDIDGTLRPDLYARLDELGVQIYANTNAKAIYEDATVLAEHYHSHREFVMGPYDTVVAAAGGKANDRLWRTLKGKVDELYCLGDAFAPRGLHDAILEGTRVARAI